MIDFVNSECSCSPYQPLRSNAEAHTNESWKESKHQKQLTLTSVIIENMAKWNTIEQQLVYFLKCSWSKYKRILCSEGKCLTILCKSTHVIGEYPSVEGLEFLRGTEQTSRYSKIYLVSLQLSEGKLSASWCLSSSPAGSVHCTVGGDFGLKQHH